MAEETIAVELWKIPDSKEIFARQKTLINLAEGLLDPEDFVYFVHFTAGSDRKRESVSFESKEEAETFYEAKRKVKTAFALLIKRKRKSGWTKLGLHLGVTVPEVEGEKLEKTVVCLDQTKGLFLETAKGENYQLLVYLILKSLPEGGAELFPIRADCTVKVTWTKVVPARVAVSSGSCSAREGRKFAHPDHDIIAMAETRAIVRALSLCLGFGETSAEEFEANPPSEPPETGAEEEEKAEYEKKTETSPERPKKAEEPSSAEKPFVRLQRSAAERKEIVNLAISKLGRAKVKEVFDAFRAEKGLPATANAFQFSDEDWEEAERKLYAEYEKVVEEKKGTE
jgi:hypothetical protein